jgi:UDP-glucose 4-epimerase
MPKAVVMGGSGFIGSHVADHLCKQGYEVVIYDCKESPWLRNDQRMVIGDLLDEDCVNTTVEGADVVYNFAAFADLNEALHQPKKTASINILGNINILDACRTHNVSRFVYASTVYVYSREGGFYRCSKQASEHYVEEYQRTYGLDYTILRYGSLYGPRADGANGLYKIVQDAIKTGKVSYAGHPESMREYIHVDNGSVVLTGQEPMRVADMLKMLAEIMGIPDEAIEFTEDKHVGHYIRTPYAYQPKLGRKYCPPMHVDLGQGLLQLIDEMRLLQ